MKKLLLIIGIIFATSTFTTAQTVEKSKPTIVKITDCSKLSNAELRKQYILRDAKLNEIEAKVNQNHIAITKIHDFVKANPTLSEEEVKEYGNKMDKILNTVDMVAGKRILKEFKMLEIEILMRQSNNTWE